MPTNLEEKCRQMLLATKKTPTHEEMVAQFRKLQMQYYPDKGGDAKSFRDLQDVCGWLTRATTTKSDDGVTTDTNQWARSNAPSHYDTFNFASGEDFWFDTSFFCGTNKPCEAIFNYVEGLEKRYDAGYISSQVELYSILCAMVLLAYASSNACAKINNSMLTASKSLLKAPISCGLVLIAASYCLDFLTKEHEEASLYAGIELFFMVYTAAIPIFAVSLACSYLINPIGLVLKLCMMPPLYLLSWIPGVDSVMSMEQKLPPPMLFLTASSSRTLLPEQFRQSDCRFKPSL